MLRIFIKNLLLVLLLHFSQLVDILWGNNGWKKITVITNSTDNTAKFNVMFGLDENYTGNITIDNVIISNLTVAQTVYLDTNISGWTTQTGVSPLINITRLTALGLYNITGWFPGNTNYTAAMQTWYADVKLPE